MASPHDDRSPREIERDLASTRDHLESTLAALQDRLSPGAMVEDAIDRLRHDGGLFGDKMLTTLRDNPLPATLMAVSLGWMMMADRRTPRADLQAGVGHEKVGRLGEAARSARDSGEGMAERLRDSGHDMTQRARDISEDLTHRGQDALHRGQDTLHEWRDQARRGGESVAGAFEDNPLLVGVLAAAAGAALAAMLPRSQWEDETLGPLRDEALERAGQEARPQIRKMSEKAADKVADKAHDATEAAREMAHDKARDAGTKERGAKESGGEDQSSRQAPPSMAPPSMGTPSAGSAGASPGQTAAARSTATDRPATPPRP